MSRAAANPDPKAAAPETLLARLRAANRVVVTSHVNPDGDAVGSSIGMARILRRMGKSVVIWLHDPPPRLYLPLPGVERIHVGPEPPAHFPDSFDLAVVLECPSLDRCGLEQQIAKLPLLNIDHHLGNQNYGAINWVDTASPAAGEMVFRIAERAARRRSASIPPTRSTSPSSPTPAASASATPRPRPSRPRPPWCGPAPSRPRWPAGSTSRSRWPASACTAS